jgi:hypothetical protein
MPIGLAIRITHATARQRLPREPQIVGVAGFLFDPDGLKGFDSEWGPRVAGLPKPYRTASCFAGAPPFDSWIDADRQRLLRDLALLIADICVVSIDSWPSHSAITAQSTPACSSSIATLCLSTCGDTSLDTNDGHAGCLPLS